MLKLLVFLVGVGAGGGAVAAWLLSEPGPQIAPKPTWDRESLQARLADLQLRFRDARQEGERQGGEAEARLRRELAAYRQDPGRAPGA